MHNREVRSQGTQINATVPNADLLFRTEEIF